MFLSHYTNLSGLRGGGGLLSTCKGKSVRYKNRLFSGGGGGGGGLLLSFFFFFFFFFFFSSSSFLLL